MNSETVRRNVEMTWKARHWCKHFGLDAFHFEANCLKLPQNLVKKEEFHKAMQEKWGKKNYKVRGRQQK